jgi:hypothetical protein
VVVPSTLKKWTRSPHIAVVPPGLTGSQTAQ